jgi:hypothetical protein
VGEHLGSGIFDTVVMADLDDPAPTASRLSHFGPLHGHLILSKPLEYQYRRGYWATLARW